jgi:tetratricopeptide (TPR) repeat protein
MNIDYYYELLGLKPGASKEEIKQAYKDLLTVWNPEKFTNEPSLQQKAREKTKEIDEAYEKLIIYLLKSSEQPSQSEFKENDNSKGSQFYNQSPDTYKAQGMSQTEKSTTQTAEDKSNFSHTQSISPSSPTATLTDEDYAAFVGKNADNYINKFKKFNIGGTDNFVATWHWPAFFAGFWWMLYRRLYLCALLSFALALIPYVNVVAWITFAITANYIYYKHSKNKLLEIKQTQQSPRMQRDVAVRTGGVNSRVVVVGIITGIIVVVAFLITVIGIPAYLGMQARARKSQAQTEVQKGTTFFEKGSYHEAIDAYSKAIELNPDGGDAYKGRGFAYLGLKDDKHAIEDFSKAIELNSQDSEAYNDRGMSYYFLKNYQLAIKDFDKAIELNPQDPQGPEVYHDRGMSYKRF